MEFRWKIGLICIQLDERPSQWSWIVVFSGLYVYILTVINRYTWINSVKSQSHAAEVKRLCTDWEYRSYRICWSVDGWWIEFVQKQWFRELRIPTNICLISPPVNLTKSFQKKQELTDTLLKHGHTDLFPSILACSHLGYISAWQDILSCEFKLHNYWWLSAAYIGDFTSQQFG